MKNTGAKKILLRTTDIVKVAAIYLLTFSMLLFAGIYINMRQNSAIKTNMPDEKLKSLEYLGYVTSAPSDAFCLTPVQYVVVSDKDNRRCCFNNNEVMYTLIEKNQNIIASMCKDNASYEKKTSGEGEIIWEASFSADNFVYIRFANEFLPQIIYNALSEHFRLTSVGEDSLAEETESEFRSEPADVNIYELIIIPQETVLGADSPSSAEHDCYAVARDKDGNVTVIFPHKEASKLYDSANIIAYNSIEGLISCDFLRNYDDLNAYAETLGIKLPPETVIFKEDTFASVLNTSNPLKFTNDNLVDTTVSYVRNFFDFLGFNLEKISPVYFNDTATYVSSSYGILRFYKDGLIQYVSKNDADGLNLEKLLGFNSDAYTSKDKLTAACNLKDICRSFSGNTVSLQLTAVSFDDSSGSLVFTFSYYFNNILIYGKEKNTDALTIKIKNNTVTEIKFRSSLFSTQENIKNLNQFLTLKQIINSLPAASDEKPKQADEFDVGAFLGGGEEETVGELQVPAASSEDLGSTQYSYTIKNYALNYFYAPYGEKMYAKWTALGKN